MSDDRDRVNVADRHETQNTQGTSRSIVFVGGGPRTVSLVERLAANAPPTGAPVTLHIVDPFPAGGGRIWRRDQSRLLWMNSTTADVTMFTDESVTCAGPIVPGPSLYEWLRGPGHVVAGAEADLGPDDFASRELQAKYLTWVYRRSCARLPQWISVVEHRTRAIDVTDLPDGARQRVRLESGASVLAELVVLAQGYLDRDPTPEQQRLQRRCEGTSRRASVAKARREGAQQDWTLRESATAENLSYTPPGYTADLDFDHLAPGQPVLVRGFGQAFVDLAVLLNQGRGGRFTIDGSDLRYRPSGREPVLYVGSRRGVPYHAKLGYRRSSGPHASQFLTLAALGALPQDLDFDADLWPLVVKELTFAHYRELFTCHADRTSVTWREFAAALEAQVLTADSLAELVADAVPDPADRFDLDHIDRPFAGTSFADHSEWDQVLVAHIRADLDRRADPRHSSDAAVFDALLGVYQVLAVAVVTGRLSDLDRVRKVEGRFHSLFSFLASGPPPQRLQEILALHEAGLVRFLGPDVTVRLDPDGAQFVGSSPAIPGEIRATALVDAFLPTVDVLASTDPVVRNLLAGGELAAQDLRDDDGHPLGAGQLLADAQSRAIRADGTVHPRRFLLGPSVSGSAGSAGFARPGHNGAGFRQNDQVTRQLLEVLHTPAQTPSRQDTFDERTLSHAS